MVRLRSAALFVQLLAAQIAQALPTDPHNDAASSLTDTLLPTHQDFIAASFMYSDILTNETVSAVSRSQADGPIQCGPGNPCKDKSCCNSDGKCGFTRDHCSPASPKTCLYNCKSSAMCGKDSLGGAIKCGLNLCCSHYGWCGTEEVHCGNADPQGHTAPCQEGYGGCRQHSAPTCSKDSGTSNGRTVAYYQSWNVKKRTCQKVEPSQINTKGLTHLLYAFASINPATWEVVPADPADDTRMREFTKLKSSTLSTWLAIGGFDFSDPGPTRTTWSDMAADSGRRAAFINSCIVFMEKYGFQGIDLDWEYPASEERGGNLDDTQNLVTLVKEMRNTFGSRYGISSVLAPDYWYLRGTDVKAMEPYMDFFGFMGYDLHGSWDADVKTLGSIIRPQSDVREIEKNLLPLWYAGIDPAKVNLGVPYYGRGYTVSDPSCKTMGSNCGFSGPSRPSLCTNNAGVVSNREIRQLIKTQKLRPLLNKEAMVKQIAWDDQWIGYDDDETIIMKTQFANSKCLGGTMIWAIDYDSDSNFGGPDYGITPKKGGEISFNTISEECNDEKKWNCHRCSSGDLSDPTAYDVDKWKLADGGALWDHVTKWYTDYAAGIDLGNLDSFTRKVGSYIANKTELDCPLAESAGQCSWADCDSNLPSPASRYLLNQFANMRAVSQSLSQLTPANQIAVLLQLDAGYNCHQRRPCSQDHFPASRFCTTGKEGSIYQNYSRHSEHERCILLGLCVE
jgi:chitinase